MALQIESLYKPYDFEKGYSRGVEMTKFLLSLYPLAIDIQKLRGDVFAAGVASYVPERVFFCTPESQYKLVRPDVRLSLSDDTAGEIPQYRFSSKLVVSETSTSPTNNAEIHLFFNSMQDELNDFPDNSLDVVTFFRIVDFGEQLNETVPILQRVLRPGGVFMGSGSSYGRESVASVFPSWNIESLVQLSNYDASSYLFNGINVGIVAQKR